MQGVSSYAKGFYSYSGFSEPELIATDLDEFKDSVQIREGYLTDSVDATKEFLVSFEDELGWSESIYGDLDMDNEGFVEDLKGFLYEYGVFVNPTLEELQEFNLSRGLDSNEYLSDFQASLIGSEKGFSKEDVEKLLQGQYGMESDASKYIANDIEYVHDKVDVADFDHELKKVLVYEYSFEEYYADSLVEDIRTLSVEGVTFDSKDEVDKGMNSEVERE